MFALIDGNNFYASCERVFQPELRGRPLIVLSNNDGCAIARSDEAKALGVTMGQPLHEIPPRLRRRLVIRSANFTLYGDMSARVGAILQDAVARVEPYSIDESFLDLSPLRDRLEFARALRERVQRWTGIPNCVGIGPTKTLAKLGNHIAKSALRKPGSYPAALGGVADLSALSKGTLTELLAATPVQELWGVGRQWTARLHGIGIRTALELRTAPRERLRQQFGVVLARTQRELAGEPCIALEDVEPDRRQILVSRSFGQRVDDPAAVGAALATFAQRACEKLRRRGLVAAAVGVFAQTDGFQPGLPQHHANRTAPLARPSADIRLILALVSQLQRGLLRKGCAYKRAGVWLFDLARPDALQGDLFTPATLGDPRLMATVDAINRRFGRNTLGLAATGWQPHPDWGMRQQHLSPCYTTCVRDLPRVGC